MQAKPIPDSAASIIIGQTLFPNTDIEAVLTNVQTERADAFALTTDSDMVAVVDIPANYFRMSNDTYRIHLTHDSNNLDEKIGIFIANTEYKFFEFKVFQAVESDAPDTDQQRIILDGCFDEVVPLISLDAKINVYTEFVSGSTNDVSGWGGSGKIFKQSVSGDQPLRTDNFISFNGDNLAIPYFVFNLKYMHLMVLFRMTSTFEDFPTLIGQYDHASVSEQAWSLFLEPATNAIYFDNDGAGGTILSRSVEGVDMLNNWVLIDALFDAGRKVMLVDGLNVKTSSYQDDNVVEMLDVNTNITIGASNNGAGVQGEFIGDMAVIKWFTEALDPIQWQREQLQMINRFA